MSGAIPPLPLYAFMVCKGRQQFTFLKLLGRETTLQKEENRQNSLLYLIHVKQ
jgi:hypothetical protein